MAKKKKQPQLSKKEKEELELKQQAKDCLTHYVAERVKRENKEKKRIIKEGTEYYGILPILEDQLKQLKDGSYWVGIDAKSNDT